MSAIAALAALYAFRLISQNAVAAYPDTGRSIGARETASFLGPMLTMSDTICAKLPTDSVIAYYLWRDVAPRDLQSRPSSNRLFIVRAESGPQGTDSSIEGAVHLFSSSETALYEWTAQTEPPEAIRRYTCWPSAGLAGK